MRRRRLHREMQRAGERVAVRFNKQPPDLGREPWLDCGGKPANERNSFHSEIVQPHGKRLNVSGREPHQVARDRVVMQRVHSDGFGEMAEIARSRG
jgi:hypothetical protein